MSRTSFILGAALLFSSLFANATSKITVLEGSQLCAFYQDPDNCYQQAIQVVSEYSEIGKLGTDQKTCDFQSGGKVVSATSFS